MKTVHDPTRFIRMRTLLVGIAMSLGLAAVGIKAVHLQVFHGSWLSEKAAAQYERSLKAQDPRGSIFDARMRELAVSINVDSIGAFPSRIANKGQTAAALAGALKMNVRELRKRLTSESSFVWIKRHVPPKEVLSVRDLALDGVEFVQERSRFYPYRTLASQVLGFSGIDGNGLEGLEFYYDQRLRGAEAELTVRKDALGRGFGTDGGPVDRNRGNNLILTIDRRVQYLTEKALGEAVEEFSAKSGIAIVMAPDSGAALAIAHYPLFNPNAFGSFDREVWRNRSITDPFEPGSTMKIFSAAAALEHGGFTPNSIFFCENGAYRVGRNTVHDTKKHGWLSLQQIVMVSSNIGAVKIVEKIGAETLYTALRNFGFGSRTGIDCPGETPGSLSHYRQWTKIDAGTIAFGQGIAVSALQLVSATAAIANGGVLMKPYIVQAITDPNGRLLESRGPRPIRRVLSVETARAVGRMMQTVVSAEGTGTNATLEGYTVAGKTGTAQKIGPDGGYAKGKYVSSFIGFAPVENPKAVILVLLDEPSNKHYGGTVAAPAFRKIAHGTLDYLNVPTGADNEQLLAGRGNGART